MIKKIFLSLLVLIVWHNFSAAALTEASKQNLQNNLQKLIAPYNNNVGLAFIDLKTGWQCAVNGTEEFPTASVGKVPVMACAYHLASLGDLDLDQKIKFRESDKLSGSGILQWLRGGQTYTLRNLCRMMIVLSDNTATKLVVDHLTMPTINHYLRDQGLEKTIIADPTMLVEPPAIDNNRTTPLEMANLLVKINDSQGFTAAGKKEMLSFMRNQRYRWGIWRGVAPGTVVADKTGNLEGILNDAGIVYTDSGNYILSIFTQGFVKQSEARQIINQASKIIYENYSGQKITARLLRRRPSAKLKRRLGHRVLASNHRSRIFRRRSHRPRRARAAGRRLSRRGSRASRPPKGSWPSD